MSLRQRKQQQNEDEEEAALVAEDDVDDDDDDIISSTQQQQQQQGICKIFFCIAIPFFIFGAVFGQNYSIQSVLDLVEQWKESLTGTENNNGYENYGTELAKAWEPIANNDDNDNDSINDVPTWCVKQQKNVVNGLIFVKLHRAASSTGAGVTLQIAKNVAERSNQETPCASRHKHGGSFLYRSEPYYLWTMIREPSKRSISDYFFFSVGRSGNEFTSHSLIKFLDHQRMEQLNYLSAGHRHPQDSVTGEQIAVNFTDTDTITTIIQDKIINVFNFIGLAERMDESLVVLKMLMHLQDEDIVVLSAKQSGGYDDGKFNNRCHYIPKSSTTPEVDEYIEGGYKTFNPDYILYHVANVSLDLTIDALGREKVQEDVHRHLKFKKIATKYCASKAIYPCSTTGELQPESEKSCLWNDAGCGYECVGEILKKYKNGEIVD